jgi:hypothetical protein
MAIFRRTSIGCEQDSSGIFRPRRQQQDATPALRNPEGHRVNHPVRPGETQILQTIDEKPHGPTAVQGQHERYILKKEPRRSAAFAQESEHLGHKTRLVTGDSSGSPSLT